MSYYKDLTVYICYLHAIVFANPETLCEWLDHSIALSCLQSLVVNEHSAVINKICIKIEKKKKML